MEGLLGGLILATATLSLATALTVQGFAKPLIDEYVKNKNWHSWITNVSALLFGLLLSYAGEFVLNLGIVGDPAWITNAALQGLIAALGATFGYEIWKNVGKLRPDAQA